VSGREVVQVYLSAPVVKIDKPVKELKAFGKTKLLKPGESETMEFTLTKRGLASFDTDSSPWTAEASEYNVQIGASSSDIRQSAVFTLKEGILVKQVSRPLTPPIVINTIKQ
jgi:beta-glucosidase